MSISLWQYSSSRERAESFSACRYKDGFNLSVAAVQLSEKGIHANSKMQHDRGLQTAGRGGSQTAAAEMEMDDKG